MVKTCKASAAAAGHQECHLHSPCYEGGRYLPEECPPCRAVMDELRALPVEHVRESAAWDILRGHLEALNHAAGPLDVPGEVAAWFASAQSDDMVPSTHQPSDQDECSPGVQPHQFDLLASRVEKIDNSLTSLRDTIRSLVDSLPHASVRDGSSASQFDDFSPRAKRPRLASGEAPGSSSALSGSLVDPSYDDIGDSDSVYASEYGDSAAEWDLPPPSERLGWRRKHDAWVVREEAGGLVGYFRAADRKTFKPLVNMEFRKQVVHGVESLFYRVKVPSSDSALPAKELVRRLSFALPTLAARVEGSPASKPSLVPMKGGRYGLDLVVKGSVSSSLGSWSDLPALWAIRASGDKTGPRSTDEAQLSSRPLRLDWEPGTSEHATVSFLRGDPSGLGPLPSSLQKPSPAVLAADKEARAQGLRLFSVSACLDLISSFLDAAVAMPQDWSPEDCKSFFSTVAEAVKGSAALLAPLTKEVVHDAVCKRVALRAAAVPRSLSSVKQDLINLEPLSPLPYGSLEGVAAILRSRPPPAQLVLKGGLEDLMRKQTRSSQASGSHGRSSSNQKGRGGKNGGGSGNDSSRRRDSPRDSRRSSSPPRGSFRGSGRGRGKQDKTGSKHHSSGRSSSPRKQN